MKYPFRMVKSITGKYELVREFDDELDQKISNALPSSYKPAFRKATVQQSKDTVETIDLPEVSIRDIQRILLRSWNTVDSKGYSKPVLIFGGSGIGKTETVTEFARSISGGIPCEGTKKDERGLPEKPREFVDIAELESDNSEKYTQVEANPGNYFLFALISGSEITPDVLRGIYKISSNKTEKGKVGVLSGDVPAYLKLMMQPEAVGMIFLDEVNQAAENQKMLYQMLLGNRAGQYQMSKRIRMVAAGNLGTYFKAAGTEDLSSGAMGRVKAYYLTVSPKDWVEYVRSKKFENQFGELMDFPEEIISFLFSTSESFQTYNELFYHLPGSPGDTSSQAVWPNPRSITEFGKELISIVSDLNSNKKPLKGDLPSPTILGKSADHSYEFLKKNLLKDIEAAASGNCGDEWGSRFTKYFYYAKFSNIDKLIKTPFTRPAEGKKGEEALDPEEYWGFGYIITSYFNKLANTYKDMDQKTLNSHLQKLAQAIFKYIPHGGMGNLKEYLKKVTQDCYNRDKDLFVHLMSYIPNMKMDEKEKQFYSKFKKEVESLVIKDKEKDYLGDQSGEK